MKGKIRWLFRIIEFIIIFYAIALTAFLLCKNKFGYTQFGDYTLIPIQLMQERNIDGVKKGELLVVQNSNDIEEGDKIYYYMVYHESYIIKSGVVTSIKNDDYSYLYTVDEKDPTTIVGTKVLGKYSTTYPKWGTILSILSSRLGFLFLVLLPILIVFIYQVYEFVMIIRYEEVEKEKIIQEEKKKDVKEDIEIL